MTSQHRLRRGLAAVATAAVATAGLGLAAPARATEDFQLTRVAGIDRYETAAQVALEAFGAGATGAVLARGDAFPDALAGAYLAGALGAPVLLTRSDEVPESTTSALEALGVETVYLLGGSAAIGSSVEEALAEDYTVERVQGPNRYATAAAVAESRPATEIGELAGRRAAILASGQSFADALAAGAVSFAANLPILLTTPQGLSPEARDALDSLEIEHVVVVGGTAAVSDATAGQVQGTGATIERVAGTNRYATAVEIADWSLTDIDGWSSSAVDLATGENFADALAGGPAAGRSRRPIVLTASATLSPATQAWLEGAASTLRQGRVLGGSAAVRDSVVAAAEQAASGVPTGPLRGQVVAVDTALDRYTFVPDGADETRTVTYRSGDTFLVDGAAATIGGFETALTVADDIEHTPAANGQSARHELTNVAAASITSGTAGNVDAAAGQLDFVHPVSGHALRADVAYGGANNTFRVDGAEASRAAFDADLNEGDTLEITGGTVFALTNESVQGSVSSIVAPDPVSGTVAPSRQFKIRALGDDPASDDNDERFVANGGSSTTDVFTGEATTFDQFAAALSDGDQVTYTREEGVETFALINRAPETLTGQGVDDLAADGDGNPLSDANTDGGSFTLATSSGPVEVEYGASGDFVIDGLSGSEAEFEAAYTAGDVIDYRAADGPSGTSQRLELVNNALRGPIDPESVNTGSTTPGGPPGDSYAVLAADGETQLATVVYVGEDPSSNTYFVNGQPATLAEFEAELDAIAAGTKRGDAAVSTTGAGDSAVTQHRLTTTATS